MGVQYRRARSAGRIRFRVATSAIESTNTGSAETPGGFTNRAEQSSVRALLGIRPGMRWWQVSQAVRGGDHDCVRTHCHQKPTALTHGEHGSPGVAQDAFTLFLHASLSPFGAVRGRSTVPSSLGQSSARACRAHIGTRRLPPWPSVVTSRAIWHHARHKRNMMRPAGLNVVRR
jgi:hypothetical protein